MSTEYDPKGKVFTHIVHKDVLGVRVQTLTHQITGEVHVEHQQRIKDHLEFAEQFIAITSAKVYQPDGALAYEAPFITLNRDHIIWLSLEEIET